MKLLAQFESVDGKKRAVIITTSRQYQLQHITEKKWGKEKKETCQDVKEEKQPILEPFVGWMIGKSFLHFLDFRSVMLVVVEYQQCH